MIKYGRYFLFHHKDLERADRFFARHGDKATFVARLLPIIRTFISLPAGISRMDFGKFLSIPLPALCPGAFYWPGSA